MFPSHENSSPAARTNRTEQQKEFSFDERTLLLLSLAHESIASAIEGRQLPLTPPSPHLRGTARGFYHALHRGELRGCVGYALPIAPLYRAVAETARAAAFDDTRFPPLAREELPQLEISLSILSPLQAIRPEEIEVGRHGLLVSMGGRRGLLLPQVPVEHGLGPDYFS